MDWREHVLNMAQQATAGFPPAPMVMVPAPTPLPTGFSPPSFDPIEILPARAQDRLRLLRVRRDDAYAVTILHLDIQALSLERTEAETRLRKLQGHPSEGGHNLGPDDASVVAQQRLVTKLNDDFRRLEERRSDRAAAFQAAGAPLRACEDWLKHGKPHGVLLQDHEAEVPKLAKNEPGLLDAVENRRRRVREIKASIHTIQSAPYSAKHAKTCAREIVEQLASRGTPDVSLLIEHDRREIVWPMVRVRAEVLGTGTERSLAFHETVDVTALIAWLHKPALIAALDRQIDGEADDPASLSHEDRQRRESEALSDLLATEFEESSLVWKMQSEGLPIEHRSDCAPQAVLGLKLITAPRATEFPGTSPEHAFKVIGRR